MKIWKNYMFNLVILNMVSCFLVFLTNKYILTSEFFSRNGQYLSGIPEQELTVYNTIQKWIYLSTIAYLAIRTGIVALLLYTALYLSEVSISFKKLFSVTVMAEFVFLIHAIIKFCHFYSTGADATLADWQRYYFLSALSFLSDVPADWHYALQTLNLFEIVYWFLLAAGLKQITGLNYDSSLKVVVYVYIPTLFVWVSTVTFFTILYFPATS